MKISIISPLYNVEQTLFDSLSSIQVQDRSAIELVLINDGSTDETQLVLDRFAADCPYSCKCLYQDNQGAASARNLGLNYASGDYIVFLDADDHFVPGVMDIIGWDMFSEKNGKIRVIRQGEYATPDEGLKNLMGGTMKWNLWLFAIRRNLIDSNNIRFIPGADMGEDMQFMLKAFACADSVKQIHVPLYRYNASNPSSISAKMNARRREEVTQNLESATSFLLASPYAKTCREYLPHLKLFIKLPLLIGFSFKEYQLWYQWMPEANLYAMRNPSLPFRVRLLQGLASRRIWLGVWFYNCCYKVLLRLMSGSA